MNSHYSVLKDERGFNTLLIPLVMSIILFLAMSGFGVWAFISRQDYKDNVDEKIETAVTVAVKEAKTEKDNEFAEKEKNPLETYQGPSDLGGIVVKYPKTWSAYVDQSGRGRAPLDGYFQPTTVPGIQSGAAYALRVEVIERTFPEYVKTFDSRITSGKTTAKAYQPVNVNNVVGVRIQGELSSNQTGIMVVLPLRDKTIKIYTESDQYFKDFENSILPNFSFTP